ncbi:Uncharacterised protein [uncultured Clostridium sp.]|nr:Uncharacterised protein [uncultured Clostridium sp.]
MKQDAFFQTIIHHIGGEGNVARKRFDGEHLYRKPSMIWMACWASPIRAVSCRSSSARIC